MRLLEAHDCCWTVKENDWGLIKVFNLFGAIFI
jgi:hypothetical protein